MASIWDPFNCRNTAVKPVTVVEEHFNSYLKVAGLSKVIIACSEYITNTPVFADAVLHSGRTQDYITMKKNVYRSVLCMMCAIIAVTAFAAPQSVKAVAKKKFDFVVGVDGDFKAALSAAASSGDRFYIFFPDGEYNIGTLTGNSNQLTTVTASDVSFIGQSADNTVVFNRSRQEGISITATLHFKNANNLYLQDLSILNKANYGNPSTYNTTGRHVAVMEQGNNIIYKNVKLLSTQDTYYTKGNRTYWENGEIHGTTDFICGGGDIFFNQVLLFIDKNSYITAPATSTSWGYVFMNCTIDGTVSSYKLGRPWKNAPKCVYINTTMKILPTAEAWGDPMNVVPALFAEYNSKTASGSSVDLGRRRTTYSKNGTTVRLNPVLSASQAAQYTIENVFGNWHPDTHTKQVGPPVVRLDGLTLRWDDNDSALCWVVFKDNNYYQCVTTNSCTIPSSAENEYTVRAANPMGGLGPVSNAVAGIETILYNLTISVAEGEGSITPESGEFAQDQDVTVTATPEIGWLFDHWNGDVTGTDNPITITMTGDKTVSAYFVQDSRTYYTITARAAAGGSLMQNPDGSKLVEGTEVTFTAIPDTGWTFNGWAGDHAGTDATWTISSLSSDISLSASFAPVDKSNYEAEAGVLTEAVTETKNTGYSGDAYVNYSTAAGASITLTVYADRAGEHSLSIVFANGSDAPRSLSVSVNGTAQITSTEFETTGNWTTWKSKAVDVTLPQGVSTVTLATLNGLDGPNVDKITLEPTMSVRQQRVTDGKFTSFYNSARKTLQIRVSRSEKVNVSIFTLGGKQVLLKNYNLQQQRGSFKIPLNGLGGGMYLFKTEADNRVITGYLHLL